MAVVETELRYWRARRGVSQALVAKAIGITQSRMSNIEKGYGPPARPEERAALAKFFGLSEDVLFAHVGSQTVGAA